MNATPTGRAQTGQGALRLLTAAVAASAAVTCARIWFVLRAEFGPLPLYVVLGVLMGGAAATSLLKLRRTTFVLALVAFVPLGAYLLLGAGPAFVGGILIAATLSLSGAMLALAPRSQARTGER